MTDLLDLFQIVERLPSTSIRHWYTAPFAQTLYQLFVYPELQAFIISGMYEEFGAERLQQLDRI